MLTDYPLHTGDGEVKGYVLPDSGQPAVVAQYNHPYDEIQFRAWEEGKDSHSFVENGIWYGHPGLVAVWRYKPYQFIRLGPAFSPRSIDYEQQYRECVNCGAINALSSAKGCHCCGCETFTETFI